MPPQGIPRDCRRRSADNALLVRVRSAILVLVYDAVTSMRETRAEFCSPIRIIKSRDQLSYHRLHNQAIRLQLGIEVRVAQATIMWSSERMDEGPDRRLHMRSDPLIFTSPTVYHRKRGQDVWFSLQNSNSRHLTCESISTGLLVPGTVGMGDCLRVRL